jgi:hypothetical protein
LGNSEQTREGQEQGCESAERVQEEKAPWEAPSALKKEYLRNALRANGISLHWPDWRDDQAFGQAVKEAAGIK